jgi:hypothetical protein
MENQLQVAEKKETTISKSLSTAAKHQLPIRFCSETDLRKAIGIGIILVGLTGANRPSAIEMTVLVDFLRKYYSDYTPDELRFAIENAMARKYDNVDYDFNPKCFGCFSTEYLGGLLKAYAKWNGGDSSVFSEFMYQFDPNEMRYSTQNYYEEFLAGSVKEFYPSNIYKQFVFDKFIKRLPGNQGNRYFPVQMEIKRVFAVAASKGIKALYTQEKEVLKISKSAADALPEAEKLTSVDNEFNTSDNQEVKKMVL